MAKRLWRKLHSSHKKLLTLNAAINIPIKATWKPVLTTPESIKAICLEASSNPKCVGVIVWMHTFSPAKMWIAGLSALQVPILHLHTQANSALPWETIDMDFMNLNQAATVTANMDISRHDCIYRAKLWRAM